MYKVVKDFYDLEDNGYSYSVGDSYPRKGKTVSKERIAALVGDDNRLFAPLIVEEKKTKSKT